MQEARQNASNQAWVTLATKDSYGLGALVLANSLRRAGTTRKKVVLITADTMSQGMRSQLERAYDEVVDVSVIDSGDAANLELLERPDLGITFTKLHCWRLTRFNKCVFLDADTMVVRNCDELFDREELSAAPDAGWPDCFNSGVFVYKPSEETYNALIQHISTQGSFDGGDQGLLNTFFSDWATKDIGKHLSFLYNMCATATYTYIPAYKYYGHNVKIIHFIGASKPWHVQLDGNGQPLPRYGEEHTQTHLKHWWQIFQSDVQPALEGPLQNLLPGSSLAPPSTSQPGGPAHPGPAHSGQPSSSQQPAAAGSAGDKRELWEEGRPDYMGSASFDNIRKKLDASMSSPDK